MSGCVLPNPDAGGDLWFPDELTRDRYDRSPGELFGTYQGVRDFLMCGVPELAVTGVYSKGRGERAEPVESVFRSDDGPCEIRVRMVKTMGHVLRVFVEKHEVLLAVRVYELATRDVTKSIQFVNDLTRTRFLDNPGRCVAVFRSVSAFSARLAENSIGDVLLSANHADRSPAESYFSEFSDSEVWRVRLRVAALRGVLDRVFVELHLECGDVMCVEVASPEVEALRDESRESGT